MKEYINGNRASVIHTADVNYNIEKVLNFDRCDEEGIKEIPRFFGTKRQLLWGALDYECEYFLLDFELSFKSLSRLVNTFYIQDLLQAKVNNKILILIPHSEYEWRYFEVECTNDEVELRNVITGINSGVGVEGFVLKFTTKYPQYDFNWINPNSVYYIGCCNPVNWGIKQVS